jgi:hypothetical protein
MVDIWGTLARAQTSTVCGLLEAGPERDGRAGSPALSSAVGAAREAEQRQ